MLLRCGVVPLFRTKFLWITCKNCQKLATKKLVLGFMILLSYCTLTGFKVVEISTTAVLVFNKNIADLPIHVVNEIYALLQFIVVFVMQ
jgi:hypothetical protein